VEHRKQSWCNTHVNHIRGWNHYSSWSSGDFIYQKLIGGDYGLNRENLKENLKIALLLILIMAMIATPIIMAAYWIYSNPVTVTVEEYTVTLTPPSQNVTKYHYANFTATLTLNGDTPSGEIVYLLYANKTFTGVSGVTNSTGQAFLQWNATCTQGTSFKAGYQTP